ncbi:hypothetical protein [Sanguibacter suaedae]|uniref:Uncharacterized protein n=1 Tax=Sanguibacter suaedae TaxID=2795737 RepID=A0A934I844_9MICO|nr:hypothetical protein [Sanguibacter suaedae]MBI9115981.1 hypothetical protein [Sanguibacter suaedae]
MALLLLGVVRLLSDWSMTDSEDDDGDEDRRFIMKANMLKKLHDKVTAWRSQWSGRKFWQYAMESMWAYGAGVMAAHPLP